MNAVVQTRKPRAESPEPRARTGTSVSAVRTLSSSLSALSLLCLLHLLAFTGCTHSGVVRPPPGVVAPKLDVVPAERVGNHLFVVLKWDKHGPWRFLVDTGSSATLVSPEFARRYATDRATPAMPFVRVRSDEGGSVQLTGVQISRLQLGATRFENTPALIYDCADLSAHFGVHVDGVLGFPLFREVVLSLDYPRSQLVIQASGDPPLLPGRTVKFNSAQRIPLIPVEVDGRTVVTLIDSGSDGSLHLNPAGLAPRFTVPPRPGGMVGTVAGVRPQEIGRLAQDIVVGGYTLSQPIVELTNELSSIGGEILRHFIVTFDQANSLVTFYRENALPITTEPRRSLGLSFDKTPAYWRVSNVVPGSPADELGVQLGDLVTRVNGELVQRWDQKRFEELVRTEPAINLTFLQGRVETAEKIRTFDLVP